MRLWMMAAALLTLTLIVALPLGLSPEAGPWLAEGWGMVRAGDQAGLRAWFAEVGLWGPVVFIVLMVLQMFLLVVPTLLLMVVAVMAYGPFWGSVLNLAAMLSAASAGYGLGRLLSLEALQRLLGRRVVERLEREAKHHGWWAVFFARVSPLLSNDGVSLVAGLVRMPLVPYFAATVAGLVPLVGLVAWLGQDWERFKPGLVVLSLFGLVTVAAKIAFDHHQRRKNLPVTEATPTGIKG